MLFVYGIWSAIAAALGLYGIIIATTPEETSEPAFFGVDAPDWSTTTETWVNTELPTRKDKPMPEKNSPIAQALTMSWNKDILTVSKYIEKGAEDYEESATKEDELPSMIMVPANNISTDTKEFSKVSTDEMVMFSNTVKKNMIKSHFRNQPEVIPTDVSY